MRHSGRFRIAHGKPPNTAFAQYSGIHSFSQADAFVLNIEQGEGLSLMPLIFWYPCSQHRDQPNGHCFLFDKMKGEGDKLSVRYKAANFTCSLEFTPAQEDMAGLVAQLRTFQSQDPVLPRVEGLSLKHIGDMFV